MVVIDLICGVLRNAARASLDLPLIIMFMGGPYEGIMVDQQWLFITFGLKLSMENTPVR